MKRFLFIPFLLAAFLMAHIPAFRFFEKDRQFIIKLKK